MKSWFTKIKICLLTITLLAGILRIVNLAKYPAGFHIDEASLGYNGYSMLKTGKDEHGNRFPLYIDMFGDNRPSGYHYLTILPISVFGLNEFATRLPGAIFGTLSVISLFYLTEALLANETVAIIAAFLLAISPWHIVSSRASSESIVALFFIMTGAALIVRALKKKKITVFCWGALSLTISFFFYHTPRVFVPLLLGCIFLVAWRHRNLFTRRFTITTIGISCAVVVVSLLLVFVVKGGVGRFDQVNIFASPETRLVMEQQLREDGVQHSPEIVSRLFHNKIIAFSLTFVSNYFDYFSGKFLFISGGRPLWYFVPGVGMLYLVELPFIVAGFVLLFSESAPFALLPILWLVASPLIASITTDDIPNIQRVLVMFPMFEIMASYGLVRLFKLYIKKRKVLVAVIVGCALMFNFLYFLNQYFINAPVHETIYRFNGFKQMVLAVKGLYNQYDHIIITKTSGGIYPHVLFFMQYDPATYQGEGSPKDPDFGGFGKFMFVPEFCPSINGDNRFPKTGKTLFVDSGTCKESALVKAQNIYREDGTVAFILVYNR